ncbi:hypothetical protein [Treponema sp.]|uniref:hypothetical protein n=1 Tax=Treponema sp. TaxID=166 RepID=UPI00298E50B2|nr:hypothetical protein [Treponema sp.]MCQ2240282.1 hypothetical protein [Treponema sp.]
MTAIALFASAAIIGCSQSSSGNDDDGYTLTKPTLPEGDADYSVLAKNAFTIKNNKRSATIKFLEDGKFEEYNTATPPVKQAEGRYSYNSGTNIVSIIYDKIANSKGKMCEINELITPEEIEATIMKDNTGENIDQLKIIAWLTMMSLDDKAKAKYGITENSTPDECYKAFIKMSTPAIKMAYEAQLYSVFSFKITYNKGSNSSGTFTAYHQEGTKLKDLYSFSAKASSGDTLSFSKTIYNNEINYEGNLIWNTITSWVIDNITNNEIKVYNSDNTATMKYENLWEDGALVIRITYEGHSVDYKEQNDTFTFIKVDSVY